MSFLPVEEQLKIIRRGTVEIVPEEELVEKLKKSYESGKPLNIKLGVDPTASDLHLGFTVVIRKLKQFQDLGHQIILIIGDYTAMVGDPSGKNKTRPRLTHAQVMEFATTYQEQFFKIVDKNKTKVVYNGDWFSKMTFADITELTSQMTVAQMLMREDFANRYEKGSPISIHEFLYPIMQGWDSVVIEADVELGATDQKFNVLVGRDYQKNKDKEQQIGLFMPILIGTDGEQKMSKSYGNYIGINEAPEEMYGKVLSISDDLIYDYFELVTDTTNEELTEIKKILESDVNPRDLKRKLARTIVRMYHSDKSAEDAEAHFDRVFVKKDIPDNIPEHRIPSGRYRIMDLIVDYEMSESKGAAKRLIQQGGVQFDGEKVSDFMASVELSGEHVLKVGKRKFLKLVVG